MPSGPCRSSPHQVFAQDAAALHHPSARRLQRGINLFGSGFGLVQGFLKT
jgi:hypothetical protein